MKFIEGDTRHVIELTRRNLRLLLLKLDDPLSDRTLIAPGSRVEVRAVEDEAHYAERAPGKIWMPSADEYH